MKYYLLLLLAIAGLLTGFVAGSLSKGESHCTDIEDEVRQQQNFSGSFACYRPGTFDADLSEKVDNSTDLKCVCRIIDDSGSRLYPVAVSN